MRAADLHIGLEVEAAYSERTKSGTRTVNYRAVVVDGPTHGYVALNTLDDDGNLIPGSGKLVPNRAVIRPWHVKAAEDAARTAWQEVRDAEENARQAAFQEAYSGLVDDLRLWLGQFGMDITGEASAGCDTVENNGSTTTSMRDWEYLPGIGISGPKAVFLWMVAQLDHDIPAHLAVSNAIMGRVLYNVDGPLVRDAWLRGVYTTKTDSAFGTGRIDILGPDALNVLRSVFVDPSFDTDHLAAFAD